MTQDDQPRIWTGWRGYTRRPRLFLLLTGLLCSTILLKYAEIQYLELIYAFQLLLLLCLFVQHDLKVRLLRTTLVLGALYLAFMVAALVLSLTALRNPFYYSAYLPLLKQPVWITVSRVLELALDAGILLYLGQEFRRDSEALAFTMRVYFGAGVASALYSILSYPLSVLHIAQLGTYNMTHRMRGFYNEGGPYGLYLLSVLVVGVALYNLKWVKRSHLSAALALLLVAFVGSQSKAAVAALIAVMVATTLMIKGVKARVAVLATFLAGAIIFSLSADLPAQLRAYRRDAAVYERISNIESGDPNLVYGRIAGAFIVPRMIEAHPLAGVGWGNYGLVRNNPRYRGASAWVAGDDIPGLGLLGATAELGIPLTLLLLLCLMFPFLYLCRIHAPLYARNLALVQPIIHIFGGQLNLTYPWVVTAFALGLGFLQAHSPPRTRRAATHVLNGPPVVT